MVHATTMTLVMAEKDPPVFRDFLGIGRKGESAANNNNSKQVQPSAGFSKRNNSGFDEDGEAETSARASSGNSGRLEAGPSPGLSTPPFAIGFPPSSEPGSEGWQRVRTGVLQHPGVKSAFYKPEIDNRPMKRRDSPIGTSLQERLQMSVEALENSRPLKAARMDDKKGKFRTGGTPTIDELRLSMQPPRPSSKGVVTVQTSGTKTEVIPRGSSKQDRSKTPLNVGGSTQGRLSHMGMSSERPSGGQLAMETMGLSPILPPAADEGSRTGMKGSGLLSNLQQQTAAPSSSVPGMSAGPSPTPRRPKVTTHSPGPDTALPSRHQFPKPPSRQLTIFYGGEAHVYDDVPPDKAEHIMQLAGSNGRSWSTTYSPRQTASIANSASEGSLSAMEREKNFNFSRGGSVSGGNLALSPEVQTLLRGLAQSGSGRSGQGPPEAVTAPSSADIQLAVAERVAAANGIRKDSLERRVLTRPSPCTEDNAEALLRGQHWM
ncbi:unnamed protein product [Calypogeia fissa]